MKQLSQINKSVMTEKSKDFDNHSAKVIDHVFNKLKVIFPAWKQSITTQEMENSIKREWLTGLQENGINTTGRLSDGFKGARASTSPFFPSCGQFVDWCSPEKRINEKAYRTCRPELPRYTSDEYDEMGASGIKKLKAAMMYNK